MYDLTCSIVLYHNNVNEIKNAVNSFLNNNFNIKLFLVDNSCNDLLRYELNFKGTEYLYNGRNLGYGAAHNIAIKKAAGLSKYHLVLNPDVAFDATVLNSLIKVMESNTDIGLIMPKVLYPNGNTQFLCKRLPSPGILFLRRFIPNALKPLFKNLLDRYELKDMDYNKNITTPNLSGCFMFLRTSIFTEVGMFDERYFMYMEDTDLCRRIHEKYQTIYYPLVSIIHDYSKGSYKNYRLMKFHLQSSLKYFNKWGWFTDKKRWVANTSIAYATIKIKEKSSLLFSKVTAVTIDEDLQDAVQIPVSENSLVLN